MSDEQEIHKLLINILRTQQEHLEEYKRVTRQSLELQAQAMERQQQFAKLYKSVLVTCGVLVVVLVLFIFYMLQPI